MGQSMIFIYIKLLCKCPKIALNGRGNTDLIKANFQNESRSVEFLPNAFTYKGHRELVFSADFFWVLNAIDYHENFFLFCSIF